MRSALLLAFTACAIAVACGSSRPALDTSEFGGNDAGGGSGGVSNGGGSLGLDAGGGPACPIGPDGGPCGCLDLSLLSDQPNLYFVLDRSGSMTASNKWQTVRNVVADVIRRLGPRAYFGAAVFPDPRTDTCYAGVEVMPPRLGDSPAGTAGPAVTAFTYATNYAAGGGTPTAATLARLTSELTALKGKTYVILATDGGPNCDSSATCDVSQCIANIESDPGCTPNALPNCCTGDADNCLDTQPSVDAVTALAKAGIATYVVGVPGSGPYADVLDQMAVAGGAARPMEPKYYAVSSTDESALDAALSAIAAQITATCTLTLQQAPPDPSLVNVYVDGQVVPKDPVNGWTLSGQTITLVGSTCQEVMSGNALDLRVVAGCPTVVK